MSSPSPALAEILRSEAILYEDLLSVLGQEEQAILAADTDALADCLARKETLALKIRLAEVSRQNTVARLTGSEHTRLNQLAGAGTGELAASRTRLKELLPRVERANGRVEVLLGRALGRLRATLDLLHETIGGGRRYGADAHLVGSPSSTLDGRA